MTTVNVLKKLSMATVGVSAVLGTFSSAASAATLFESTLSNVNIEGTNYNVIFRQYDGGPFNNSFNAFYGTDIPTFTFTTAQQAYDAIEAIRAALLLTPVDVTPAPGSTSTGLRVPFAATATDYSYRTSFNGGNFPTSPTGSFTFSRTSGNPFSMTFFESADTTSVPEPASLIGILGLGAFGVTSLRKRKQVSAVEA
ncbi:PEP-CTERM sorting domain-containing protein [Anabaena sp. UHCC 0253]|uniref:PEP-CTERM sorting domain-containing protein n=1 Tax=Anabaena sp. UHCC 0253 TaxID=2590019 RepID=UPI0014470A99|nr:PEP-CTERM sorting domain-containing protein [Anabaena sp. UHCC 0253]MTJ51326.1 PEP-CTERM sorting domain-containing protein [Anabaena sp. UHCC 0253]